LAQRNSYEQKPFQYVKKSSIYRLKNEGVKNMATSCLLAQKPGGRYNQSA
jgi:hypothetical protein